jgi:hypothetical protein
MFVKFEILVGTVTLTGTVHGESGNWSVAVKSGSETLSDETAERSWHTLFDELVAEACAKARRNQQRLAAGAMR